MNYSLETAGSPWSFALGAAAAAAVAYHAAKSQAGRPLLLLRAAAAALLIFAALKPTLAYRQPLLIKPRLTILLDTAHSMRDGRLDTALAWLRKNKAAILRRAEVSVASVADRGRPLGSLEGLGAVKATNASFQAADSLRDLLDDPAASSRRTWLFSDGNAEPAEDLDRVLGRWNAPIDVLGVGPSRREKGLAFSDIKTPDFVFLHSRFEARVSVDASDLAGRKLKLRLLKESPRGGKREWLAVEEKESAVRSEFETLAASFTAAAQSLGRERYRLEASAGNAAAVREFRVEVIRQKYRIMYLSGRPSPEYSFLREFLKSDPNHELVSFVILRNPENPSYVPENELSLIPFPADEIFVQSLNQFDLFILENFSYRRFNLPVSYLAALKGFVSSGGALLVIGGENAFGLGGYRQTPVEELLPVTLSQETPDFLPGLFRAQPAAADNPLVRLYDSPEASKAAWEALPELDGFARFGSVRPDATVLAVHPRERTSSGQPLPVLAIRDFGRGKVMLVSSDSTWRWRLGAAADWKTSAFYGRFWSRAVSYLTGSLDLSKVKFAPLPDRIPPREPAAFAIHVFDENFHPASGALAEVSVAWTAPGGQTRLVAPVEKEPGVFSLELTGLSPGSHRLKASARLRGKPWGEDQASFLWEAAAAEAPMDRAWLKKTAEATGGEMADLKAASLPEMLDRLPRVREEAQVRERYYPWTSAPWLWLAAGLFVLEWALRRRRGHA